MVVIPFKIFYIYKNIKIIFFILKKLFLILAYQNNINTFKNIFIYSKIKIKKINFFQKCI